MGTAFREKNCRAAALEAITLGADEAAAIFFSIDPSPESSDEPSSFDADVHDDEHEEGRSPK